MTPLTVFRCAAGHRFHILGATPGTTANCPTCGEPGEPEALDRLRTVDETPLPPRAA